MYALDGNAIAGPLLESFGVEMTEASGTCAHCGNGSRIAELAIYLRAPGTVVRCPTCAGIVMVLVEIRGALRVHMDGFRLERPPV
jgi:diaminopimelate epimerase